MNENNETKCCGCNTDTNDVTKTTTTSTTTTTTPTPSSKTCSTASISNKNKNSISTNNESDTVDNDNYNTDFDHQIYLDTDSIETVKGYDLQRLLYKIERAGKYLPSIQSIPYMDDSKPESKITTINTSNSDNKNNNNNTKQPSKYMLEVMSFVSHLFTYDIFSSLRPEENEIAQQNDPSTTPNNSSINQKKNYYLVEFGCSKAKLSNYVGSTIYLIHDMYRNIRPRTYNYILIDQKRIKATEQTCDEMIRARQQKHANLEASSSSTTSSNNNTTTINVQRFTKPISSIRLYDIIHSSNNDDTTEQQSNDESEFTKKQQQQRCSIICMAKHVCGSATDDAIQCIQQYHHDERQKNNHKRSSNNSQDSSPQQNIIPLAIAPCCHYQCNIDTFLTPMKQHDNVLCQQDAKPATTTTNGTTDNLSYLEYLGFDKRDIEVMMIISQWATINFDYKDVDVNLSRKGVDGQQQQIESEFPPRLPSQPIPTTIDDDNLIKKMIYTSWDFEGTFTFQQQYDLGQYSKVILDTARAFYLKNHCNYSKVQLVYFTTLSSEKNLIIAT